MDITEAAKILAAHVRHELDSDLLTEFDEDDEDDKERLDDLEAAVVFVEEQGR